MLDLISMPEEVRSFIGNAKLTDTSGHSGAKTYYIDKGCGYYLKIWHKGSLERDYEALSYFTKYSLSPKPVMLISGSMDYMITESAKGEPAIELCFLERPHELAIRLGQILRSFHDSAVVDDCPLRNTTEDMISRVIRNFHSGKMDEGMLEFVEAESAQQAYDYIMENAGTLKNDAVLHGDYCLPNILLDDEMNFSCFIDLNAAGVGDRHYDIHWGRWSLAYNLQTRKYEQLFLDSYGCDAIDMTRLKTISYISCLDE